MNILALVLLFLFQTNYVKQITIDPQKDQEVTFNLSEISENVSYVKLETDDRCMIGQIKILKQEENKIFIVSQVGVTSRFYVFSKDGKFLSEIGKTGRGPGEFATLVDFAFNTAAKKIYLLDSMGSVYVYDYSGNYISSIRLESRPHGILYAKNSLFLFIAWPDYYLNNGYGIHIMELTEKIKDIYLLNRKYLKIKKQPGMMIYPNYVYFVDTDETVNFYEEKFDTLYSIDKKFNVRPKIVLNLVNKLPQNLITSNEYNSAVKKYFSLYRVMFVNNYLFFSVMTPSKPFTIYLYRLNLSTGELMKHDTKKDKEYIVNDIDGGLHFKPEGVASKGTLYSSLECEKLKNQLLNSRGKFNAEKRDNLIKMIGSSGYADNPIIMLVKVK